jgi:hypothetical protein
VIIAAREGAMQCPRCSYVLSYSDALLCRVGDTHYCPRCWSRIPDQTETDSQSDGGPHDATTDERAKQSTKDDAETHVALPEDKRERLRDGKETRGNQSQ